MHSKTMTQKTRCWNFPIFQVQFLTTEFWWERLQHVFTLRQWYTMVTYGDNRGVTSSKYVQLKSIERNDWDLYGLTMV
jgi:hypothetical protein